MTYEEALEYIHGISWTFCKPGLDRISELCTKLGNPQNSLKFIHVAGTNGKGSFCAMADSILRKAGYKVGLYTSPYIVDFCERMRFMGENISRTELADICKYVKPIADSMTDKPTEFELITAIAFEFFKRCGADIVILEAGMGGRLDSTNIISTPILSVITGISLDHTAFLGDTVAAIAKEKSGIIKPSVPVLFGGCDKEAERVISAAADAKCSELSIVDYSKLNIHCADLTGSVFDYLSYQNIKISMLGLYQPRNASLVLTAVNIIKKSGYNIPDNAVYSGLAECRWPARFEIINSHPTVIFDGAHNAEGIESAVAAVKHYFPSGDVIAISGVLCDKDYNKIARDIASATERVYTITPPSPRALDAKEYAAILSKCGTNATFTSSIDEAVKLAISDALASNRAIVCLGSLYTYSDVLSAVKKLK